MNLPKQGNRIVWLVRSLTFLSLLTVIVTLGLVGWTLMKVREERARAAAEQTQLDYSLKELRERVDECQSGLQAVLDETAGLANQQNVATGLIEFVLSQSRAQADAGVPLKFEQFEPLVARLTAFSQRAYQWRGQYDTIWADVSQQRTMGQARNLIFKLRATVETLEGRRRLDEAIRYKRWRGAAGEDANRQARSILIEHARQQSQGTHDFKSELAECARLVELLGGEEQFDNLADLKDNKLRPVLDRLRQTVLTFGPEHAEAEGLTAQSIEDLGTVLFGQAAGPNNVQAGSGGLYALRQDALRLRREREGLRNHLAGLFQDIEAANGAFAKSAQMRSDSLTHQMEQGLAWGWRRMVLFGGGCSALFLWLALVISRGIRGQVHALEHARAEAETGRQTTQKLMVEQQAAMAELAAAHQNLQASEQRFRTLSVSAPIGIFLTDATGLALYANPHCQGIMGLSLEESLGEGWRRAVHPEDAAEVFAGWQSSASAGRDFDRQFRFGTVAGEVRWVHVRSTGIRSETGEVTGHVGTVENITERQRAEAELARTQNELLETSRKAGMAEVATGVLHNVGNVLNSVNVASTCLANSLRKSKAANLSKVVALLHEREADLGVFLSTDARGKQIPGYLAQLADHLAGEQSAALEELAQLQKNIEHIKDIVTMQQSFAKVAGIVEQVKVTDLVEDALRMNSSALARHDIQVIREIEAMPPITVEKHKVLQILVNLVCNGKQSCDESGRQEKQLTLRVTRGKDCVRIAVRDNGVGIPPENLTRIFAHGFTTKKEGHGFGLHSGALAAREMGGSLTVHSDGPGQGAVFILQLPVEQESSAKLNAA